MGNARSKSRASWENTQRRAREAADKARAKAREVQERAQRSAREAADKARAKAREVQERAQRSAREAQEKAKQLAAQTAAKAREAQEKAKQALARRQTAAVAVTAAAAAKPAFTAPMYDTYELPIETNAVEINLNRLSNCIVRADMHPTPNTREINKRNCLAENIQVRDNNQYKRISYVGEGIGF
jgi:hypothetical protein